MHYIHRLHVMISNDLLQEPRNAESTSALSQHWVSIKRPAPPLLMLASLVSIVLLGAPLERWQWCTCFMYPARCTIVFSSRIESNRNQSSHGLWPNSSLWWPMQIYAVCVCVCFSTKETDTYSHHLFRKKKYIKPVRLLISFMHVDRSIMQMQRNSAVAHEVLTEQTEFLVSLMSLSHLSSHLSHLSRSSRSAHSARPSGWPG